MLSTPLPEPTTDANKENHASSTVDEVPPAKRVLGAGNKRPFGSMVTPLGKKTGTFSIALPPPSK